MEKRHNTKACLESCFEDCTFVIFGAGGDLSKRKLIPAICKLVEDNKLCKFAVIGASIDETNTEKIFTQAQKFVPKTEAKIINQVRKAFSYYQMDFHNPEKYPGLHSCINEIEKKYKLSGNRIFYFATMPEHFTIITKNLVDNKIVKKHPHIKTQIPKPWNRVVYEKPFGYNLKSSQKINSYLEKIFDESQIFRIDHYLAKELVGNIALTRFTNHIFEPLWNNKHIESIQIILNEKIGIEKRGAFYDHYGATRDMVQSHMLQMLALTAMEAPKKLNAQYIRDAKARVLKNVIVDNIIRGQYDGYRTEKHVDPQSKTETFVALKLFINNRRWKNVPFYLKTGKYLDKKETSIHIKFKKQKCLLIKCPSDSNYLTIRITPHEGIYLELNTKVPAKQDEVTPVTMEFAHSILFGLNTPEAYETLLADVINGDQSAFVRNDEVKLSWKIINQIDKLKSKLYTYPKKSAGPKELESLDKTQKILWRA